MQDERDFYIELWKKDCEAQKRFDKDMRATYSNEVVEGYRKILAQVDEGDKSVDESTMQDFFEHHTALFPTSHFMQNHGLHFNSFVSKFSIGPYVTDFAYLTKSTVEWWVVLVEIENPHKKLFKGNPDHADFTADYTQSRQQIRDWKAFIEDHKNEVVDTLHRIRKPLEYNKVSFKYLMVMGRRDEIEHSEARRRALAEESNGDLKIITYDTLLSDYERQRRIPVEGLMLTMYDRDRFRCKYLPSDAEHKYFETIETDGLFAYMSCDDIYFSDEQIQELKAEGYEMDSWLQGKYLIMNEKYTEAGYAKTLPEGSAMKALFEKEPLSSKRKV